MITNDMRKYLESLSSKIEDKEPSHLEYMKELVYLNRINRRIDRELDNLLWLCRNHPDIFLHGQKEDSPNMRLKKLLLCIKALNPRCDVELVLRNLKDESKEVRIPYTKTVMLEGLNLVKSEKFEIPLEPLNISKKETIQLPFKTKVKVKPDAV